MKLEWNEWNGINFGYHKRSVTPKCNTFAKFLFLENGVNCKYNKARPQKNVRIPVIHCKDSTFVNSVFLENDELEIKQSQITNNMISYFVSFCQRLNVGPIFRC